MFIIPKVLRKLFYEIFPDNHFRPGIIASTQTFGDLLIWHPHIRCLVTDGVFDLAGSFHPLPGIDSDQATILFREKVFAMMKENNRISDGLVEKMRNWHHSGFSVHGKSQSAKTIGKPWPGYRSTWYMPHFRQRKSGMSKRPAV